MEKEHTFKRTLFTRLLGQPELVEPFEHAVGVFDHADHELFAVVFVEVLEVPLMQVLLTLVLLKLVLLLLGLVLDA